MRRVVIESPYAGDVAANVRYARRCLLDSFKRGEAPFASHLLYTQEGVLDDAVESDRELGLTAAALWDMAASLAAVYVDRGISRGMLRGIARHRRRGVPIECRSVDAAVGTVIDCSKYLCTCDASAALRALGNAKAFCVFHTDPGLLEAS